MFSRSDNLPPDDTAMWLDAIKIKVIKQSISGWFRTETKWCSNIIVQKSVLKMKEAIPYEAENPAVLYKSGRINTLSSS